MIRPLLALLLAVMAGNADAGSHDDFDRRLSGLAQLCRQAMSGGDDENALSVCRRVGFDLEKLAPGSPPHVDTLLALAELKLKTANYPIADAYYETALGYLDQRDRFGLDSARVLELQGQCKISRGKPGDAERLLLRALQIREKRAGPFSLDVARTRLMDADALTLMAQYADADQQYRRALEGFLRAGPAARDEALHAQRRIAELMERQSRFAQAEDAYRELVDDALTAPPRHDAAALPLDRLAWIAAQDGRAAEAATLYQRELIELRAGSGDAETVASVEARRAALTGAPVAQ